MVIGTARWPDPLELEDDVADVQPGIAESLFEELATFGIQIPEASYSP